MRVLCESVLLLPCFACLFWMVTLLCSYKTNHRLQNRWIAPMGMIGVSVFVWNIYLLGNADYYLFYKLDVIETFSTLLFYPLFYYYLKSLIGQERLSWCDVLWLLPVVMIGGWNLLFYTIVGNQESARYMCTVLAGNVGMNDWDSFFFKWQYLINICIYNAVIVGFIVCMISYVVRKVIPFLRHSDVCFESGWGKKHFRVIQLQLFMAALFFVVNVYGHFCSFSHSIFISFILVVWGVIVYYVGYDIYKMDNFVGDETTADCTLPLLLKSDEKEEDGGSQELNHRTSHLLATFLQMIDEEKIYLQSDLRLEDLASLMNTNRTYLSRLINEEFRCTFSDYFNKKRIEYAQDLMFRFPLLTQEEIAKQSGFAYSSSFSRIFRQHAGVTFREWRKKNLIEY